MALLDDKALEKLLRKGRVAHSGMIQGGKLDGTYTVLLAYYGTDAYTLKAHSEARRDADIEAARPKPKTFNHRHKKVVREPFISEYAKGKS